MKLGLVKILSLSFSRDADVWWRFKVKILNIPKLKFDQDLRGTCDMNLTLGSVVPLAMFFFHIWLLQF